MKRILLLFLLLAPFASAQTPVVLMPVPKPQFFDNSGRPLAFGCVFSYESGSSTPLATYTDYTGSTQNSNPVVLTSGGFTASGSDGIWLQAGLAYRLVVRAAGGTNCASGTTQYTIDGIGGGTTTLTTNVTYSSTPTFNIQAQNQLFIMTLTGDASAQPITAVGIVPPAWVTFEIVQDAVGGHTFTWPSNSADGAAVGGTANQVSIQSFVWDGTTLRALGPGLSEQVPTLSHDLAHFSGDVIAVDDGNFGGNVYGLTLNSQCTPRSATGAIRLCKTDALNWRNQGDSADYGILPDASDRGVYSFSGGNLFSGTTPDIFLGGTTSSFPRLKRNGTAVNFRLGDDSADAPITASTIGASDVITSTSSTYDMLGTEVSTPGSPPATGKDQLYPKASSGWCGQDSSSVEYCMTRGTGQFIQHISTSSACTTAGGGTSFTNCTNTLTWPVTFGTTNYDAVCTGTNPNMNGDPTTAETAVLAIDSQSATQIVVITMSNRSTSAHYTKISCIGIKQ